MDLGFQYNSPPFCLVPRYCSKSLFPLSSSSLQPHQSIFSLLPLFLAPSILAVTVCFGILLLSSPSVCSYHLSWASAYIVWSLPVVLYPVFPYLFFFSSFLLLWLDHKFFLHSFFWILLEHLFHLRSLSRLLPHSLGWATFKFHPPHDKRLDLKSLLCAEYALFAVNSSFYVGNVIFQPWDLYNMKTRLIRQRLWR